MKLLCLLVGSCILGCTDDVDQHGDSGVGSLSDSLEYDTSVDPSASLGSTCGTNPYPLLGKIHVTLVWIDSLGPEISFPFTCTPSGAKKPAALNDTKAALSWVEKQASVWGVNVEFSEPEVLEVNDWGTIEDCDAQDDACRLKVDTKLQALADKLTGTTKGVNGLAASALSKHAGYDKSAIIFIYASPMKTGGFTWGPNSLSTKGPYTFLFYQCNNIYLIAHEFMHIFGAQDEYEGQCTCAGSWHCLPVGNCAGCAGAVYDSCIMRKAKSKNSVCPFTAAHLGWPGLCVEEFDCPTGFLCGANGYCDRGCQSDGDCASWEYCDSNDVCVMALGCAVHEDCGPSACCNVNVGTCVSSGVSLGQTCSSGMGACQQQGTTSCAEDGQAKCSAIPKTPALQDTCNNGIDDDCNNLVDDGCPTGPKPTLETCNGKDDDLNGVPDDGSNVPGCSAYWTDLDKDGYGHSVKGSTCLCPVAAEQKNLVAKGGDCDDANKSVHPNAVEQCGDGLNNDCDASTSDVCTPTCTQEVCNGKDDDCDGKVDETPDQDKESPVSDCKTFWADEDGDGYGWYKSFKCLCQGVPPFAAKNSDDCDDDDQAVHPGASETCDGKDNDCDSATPADASCGECKTDTDCLAYEDGNLCNGQLYCTASHACAVDPASVIVCGGPVPSCQGWSCNPGSGTCEMKAVANGTVCSDGNPCTTSDSCIGGTCSGANGSSCCTTDSQCNDDNPCTTDLCDAGTGMCKFIANAKPCDDNNPCTTGDSCDGGVCSGTPSAACCKSDADCNDTNACTNDSCNTASGTCTHVANAAACDDGSACTKNDACSGGACAGQKANLCGNKQCGSDACGNTCGSCPGGSDCTPAGQCVSVCACSGGVCCDGCKFRSSSWPCDDSLSEKKCEGYACGDNQLMRTGTRYCSGSNSSCDGSLQWSSWSLATNCSESQVCSEFTASACQPSASCVTAAPVAWVSPTLGCAKKQNVIHEHGTGFTPWSQVTIANFGPGGQVVASTSVGSDGDGAFDYSYSLPYDGPSGFNTFRATDNSSGLSAADVSYYVVLPSVMASPGTASVGTTIIQNGWGFSPNTTANLEFTYPDGATATWPRAVAADGTFDNAYTVPATAKKGSYSYRAYDTSCGWSESVFYGIQ